MNPITIPHVAANFWPGFYTPTVTNWGVRFRAHMKLHSLSQETLADAMGRSQGAVGHWISGRRDINLNEFFKLCEAAGADPRLILFPDSRTEEALTQIGQILKAHPELNPAYKPFEKGIKRKKAKAPAKVP